MKNTINFNEKLLNTYRDSFKESGEGSGLCLQIMGSIGETKDGHSRRFDKINNYLNSTDVKSLRKEEINCLGNLLNGYANEIVNNSKRIKDYSSVKTQLENLTRSFYSRLENPVSNVIYGKFNLEQGRMAVGDGVQNNIYASGSTDIGGVRFDLTKLGTPEGKLELAAAEKTANEEKVVRTARDAAGFTDNAFKPTTEEKEVFPLPIEFPHDGSQTNNQDKPGYIPEITPIEDKPTFWGKASRYLAATALAVMGTACLYAGLNSCDNSDKYAAKSGKPKMESSAAYISGKTEKPVMIHEQLIDEVNQKWKDLAKQNQALENKVAVAGLPDNEVRARVAKEYDAKIAALEANANKAAQENNALKTSVQVYQARENSVGLGVTKNTIDALSKSVYNITSNENFRLPEFPLRSAILDGKTSSLADVVDYEFIGGRLSLVDSIDELKEVAETIAKGYSPAAVKSDAWETLVAKCGGDLKLANQIEEKFNKGTLNETILDNLAQFIMTEEDGSVVFKNKQGEIVVFGSANSIMKMKGESK